MRLHWWIDYSKMLSVKNFPSYVHCITSNVHRVETWYYKIISLSYYWSSLMSIINHMNTIYYIYNHYLNPEPWTLFLLPPCFRHVSAGKADHWTRPDRHPGLLPRSKPGQSAHWVIVKCNGYHFKENVVKYNYFILSLMGHPYSLVLRQTQIFVFVENLCVFMLRLIFWSIKTNLAVP